MLANILFLIVGLLIGFLFGYILERCKERRLKRKIAITISNEIESCCQSAKRDLGLIVKHEKFVNKTKEKIPEEVIKLSILALSSEFYRTIFFESYMDHIHLFKDNTQISVGNLFATIFHLKGSHQSLGSFIEDYSKFPKEMIRDTFEKEKMLRNRIIDMASECKELLEKEK